MSIGFNDTDIEKIARQARKTGWTVTVTGGNHVKWISPNKEITLTSGLTANTRSWANFKVLLRKAGLMAHKNQKKKSLR